MAKATGELALHYETTNGENLENTNQSVVNTVLSDYSVELLEHKLRRKIRKLKNAKIGNLVQAVGEIQLYDFENISDSTSHKIWHKVMNISDQDNIEEVKNKYTEDSNTKIKQITNDSMNTLNFIDQINLLGEFGKKVFSNVTLLVGEDYIVYSKTNKYRMNKNQLGIISNSSRKLHVLGIIENRISSDDENWDQDDIGEIAPQISNELLLNFNIAEPGMFEIKPLAMYYEI